MRWPQMTRPGRAWASTGASRSAAAWAAASSLTLASIGCPAPAPAEGPGAQVCGRVVAHYLGVHSAVEIVDTASETDTGKVRIDYRSMDDMNTPIEGVALCRFEDVGGKLALTGAFVDENRLPDAELARFNVEDKGSVEDKGNVEDKGSVRADAEVDAKAPGG